MLELAAAAGRRAALDLDAAAPGPQRAVVGRVEQRVGQRMRIAHLTSRREVRRPDDPEVDTGCLTALPRGVPHPPCRFLRSDRAACGPAPGAPGRVPPRRAARARTRARAARGAGP